MASHEPHERENESKPGRFRKLYGWLLDRLPSQITITPTIAITVTLSITFTMTIAVTGIVYTLFFQDTGWTVDQAQASTSYTVSIEQGLEVKENLTVDKALEVKDDISITGSALNMAGTPCRSETPLAALSLCFDATDNTLKAAKNGGPYETIEGVPGPPGTQGLPGP
ncbi:MAG: hypothetical protein ACE5Q6_26295, partial [Dehalococcoidia bacterium]